jgi:hypothetical protein
MLSYSSLQHLFGIFCNKTDTETIVKAYAKRAAKFDYSELFFLDRFTLSSNPLTTTATTTTPSPNSVSSIRVLDFGDADFGRSYYGSQSSSGSWVAALPSFSSLEGVNLYGSRFSAWTDLLQKTKLTSLIACNMDVSVKCISEALPKSRLTALGTRFYFVLFS